VKSIEQMKWCGLACLTGILLLSAPLTARGEEASASAAAAAAGTGIAGSTTPARTAVRPLTGHIIKLQTGLREIGDCSRKLRRSSLTMMGELTRFNLLWGNPPATPHDGNILYGGALTREQVLNSYRELPSLVFTAPMYVQRFSYPLPPRKKMLTAYTRQLGEQVNRLLTYIANMNLDPAADNPEQSTAAWQELNRLARDVEQQYMAEYHLVENTTDDDLKKDIRENQKVFGAPLLSIYNDMGKVNDLLKELSRTARKTEKPRKGNV